MIQHRLVAAHAGEVVDIARLGHADHGVDQQVRLRFARCAERQFLMRPVQRVARLERHDALPAQFAEIGAQLVRRVAAGLEIIVDRLLDAGHRAAQIDGACDVMQIVHRRMGQIIGAKDLQRLIRLVGHPFVGDREDGKDHPFLVAQGNVLAGGHAFGEFLGHIQRDGNGPESAIGGAHGFHGADVIGFRLEPLERVEAAVHQQFQIADLPRGQVPGRQIARRDLQLGGRVGRDVKFGNGGVDGHGQPLRGKRRQRDRLPGWGRISPDGRGSSSQRGGQRQNEALISGRVAGPRR